jgi:hypothetical protein
VQFLGEFNEKLLKAIDETLVFCLGDLNARLIYDYLEKVGCSKQEIPEKLDVFVEILEKLVGIGRGQILGASSVMENAILKAFCKKLGINYEEVGSGYLPNQVRKVKEIYNVRPRV